MKLFQFSILTVFILVQFRCSTVEKEQFDIAVTGSQILDGTGSDPYYGTVIISGDSIVGILDPEASFNAEEIIDASGKVLTPGFIDLHAHGNPLKTPEFKNFISQGVTSICLGQDGSSSYLNNLEEWIENVNNETPSVNIIPFAGHNTIRLSLDQAYESELGKESVTQMQQKLAGALEKGLFGLSTGLEYNPGYFANQEELRALAETVGSFNGLIMSHMRNEDDDAIENSIRELIDQGQYCNVHIAHFKDVYGSGKERANQLLNLLDSAREHGIKITTDLYPYEASYTGFGIVFPEWAKPPAKYDEVKIDREKELKEYLRNRVIQRNGPEAMLIGTGNFAGKTLAHIAKELNTPFEDLLFEWGPNGGSAAYFVMDKELQERLLEWGFTGISSDGSPTMHHPRGYGSFTKVLEQYVINDSLLALEGAIRKMTRLSSDILGLKNRGYIKVGYKADLVIFDPEKVKSNADFTNPHQLSSGINYVFVNGTICWKEDNLINRHGKVILKK